MTALILPILGQLRALLMSAQSWTCDKCRAVNSDSVSSCYRCGA